MKVGHHDGVYGAVYGAPRNGSTEEVHKNCDHQKSGDHEQCSSEYISSHALKFQPCEIS